jgi:hypothetical protein
VHKLLIHPFGDSHHTLHLFGNIPGYDLARLPRWLLINDPAYAEKLRYRLRVLEQPRRNV